MPLKATRACFKGQLTSVQKFIEEYKKNPERLQESEAERVLQCQRELISRIELKFQDVQTKIIHEAASISPQESESERVELIDFLGICAKLEQDIAKLIVSARSHQDQKSNTPSEGAIGGQSNTQLADLFTMMSTEMKQQRIDLLAAQKQQREDFQKLIEQMKPDHNSSNFLNESMIFQNPVKLEPMKVPVFSGDYTEWRMFRDMFISCIDQHALLTKGQKMQFLVKSLDGEAKELVSHLEPCDDNYPVAWSSLVRRYEDKQTIVKTYIDKFLDQQKMTRANAKDLRKIQSTTTSALNALDAIEVKERDPWLIHFTLSKLDRETQRLWAEEDVDSPTWAVFDEFLNKRSRALEHCFTPQADTSSKSVHDNSNKRKASSYLTEESELCIFCQIHAHKLYRCRKFLNLTVKKRLEVVNELKICPNCLSDFHSLESCSFPECRACSQKHNRLLHEAVQNASANTLSSLSGNTVATLLDQPALPLEDPEDPSIISNPAVLSCADHSGGVNSKVLFATAIVTILDRDNKPFHCRVVLDPASQVNIISTGLCQLLRLDCSHTNFAVAGVGDFDQISRHETQIKISYQRGATKDTLLLNCLVMKKVTGEQPNWNIDSTKIPIHPRFKLADPSWFKRQQIDLLIGGAHSWSLLLPDRHELGDGLPMLQGSVFGWLVVGPCFLGSTPNRVSCNLTSLSNIDRALRKFWELEEIPKEEISADEQKETEQLFASTTVRNDEGRYVVHLPFNNNLQDLSDNRANAIRQLAQLDRRLLKNPDLMRSYGRVFEEYMELGIIEPVPADEMHKPRYYLPHHCVVKEASTSTKVRVVFNASSKSQSGLSLNDCMKIGPVVQPPLIAILWKFRLHEVAMTCDITKMYLQVLLHGPHKDYQRFVWRFDGQLQDLRFKTVCFGIASSPFLATRVLNQLAEDDGGSYSLAASVIRSNFYVDDCLYSCPTIEEMQSTKAQLIEIMNRAGMKLSKFRSNFIEILSSGNQDEPCIIPFDEEAKTLGIVWNPNTDTFSFKTSSTLHQSTITMRSILSTLARIYDPCGFIGPVVVVAKLIFQETWRFKLTWDQPVPDELLKSWMDFKADLPHIEKLQIPRWISTISQVTTRELHAFCDASMVAYGVAIYLVCNDEQGNRTARLLTSRSKITPIKSKEDHTRTLTIPKAELSGALMAAELMDNVSKSLDIKECYFWTDATVVLHQIYNPRGKREQFVTHRVQKILKSSEATQWGHVRTADNPADVLSRGSSAQRIISHDLWWNGPKWLCGNKEAWPPKFSPWESAAILEVCAQPVLEEKELLTSSIYNHLLAHISTFTRMQRVLSWCVRWREIIKLGRRRRTRNSQGVSGCLTVGELKNAEIQLIKWEQETHFSRILLSISRKTVASDRHCKPIRNLRPFIDSQGVMRVGGRLQHSDETYNAQHQVILPNGRLALLIARREHKLLLHAGPQHMLASLRQRYWPLNGRNLVRKVFRECTTCLKVNPSPAAQIMGNLPRNRVTYVRPFWSTGVDFTGHFFIKRAPRKSLLEKAYVVIFVCMSVKAVHLELVSSMTTEAFIAALRRFTARRGYPAHIYSDNATNFLGADKELRKLWKSQEFQDSVADFSSGHQSMWHFNPPRAPHHGGLWESAVKSFKYHFRRIIGETRLSHEEMYTVLTQIEAVLNSRPLVALRDHSDDLACLTPGHFLTGTAPTQLPDPTVMDIPTSRLNKWQLCQRIQQDFGRRWKREYLHTLQIRSKWSKEHQNVKVGDIVLLLDQEYSSTHWPLGIITRVFVGADKAVRVATVKTHKSSYDRPITKLVKLVSEDETKS